MCHTPARSLVLGLKNGFYQLQKSSLHSSPTRQGGPWPDIATVGILEQSPLSRRAVQALPGLRSCEWDVPSHCWEQTLGGAPYRQGCPEVGPETGGLYSVDLEERTGVVLRGRRMGKRRLAKLKCGFRLTLPWVCDLTLWYPEAHLLSPLATGWGLVMGEGGTSVWARTLR